MLAVNHPNSFLDAIILATLFEETLYSLARGDAFITKKVSAILKAVHILPVYRHKEGIENLHFNYNTFDACMEIFKQHGIVLIFSEALSKNEWKLRPLKKGTARLALAAWQQNIPLKILPIGINYNSFNLFGKNVRLNFGEFITQENVAVTNEITGRSLNELTIIIEQQLTQLVYTIDKNDATTKRATFIVTIPFYKKILLAIPATIGLCTHAPLYLSIKLSIVRRYKKSGHYNAIMTVLLAFAYPIYLLLIAFISYRLTGGWWWVCSIFLLPFFAWSYLQLNKQIDT